MELIRIGDKLVSPRKITETVERILALRQKGLSQQEVADKLQIDRTFISRLESVGEVRKGKTVAIIGFPIENKEEIYQVAAQEGVDFIFLLSEKERWAFAQERTGVELLDIVMDMAAQIRQMDSIILIGSDKRIRVMQAFLGREVIPIQIGPSPITKDVRMDPEQLRETLRMIK
ncbi:MAG: helix-turn-helix domain-containing protein [Firmicutes bacterium]|nr:helix-turn-helix domain-containing protein [Bacillota bacterium]